MQIETYLSIANIIVSLIIGVFVALRLGKLNFKKEKRVEIINSYISFHKSIVLYSNWHKFAYDRKVFQELYSFTRNLETNDYAFNQYYITICNKLIRTIYKRYETPLGSFKLTPDDTIEVKQTYYDSINPYYELELLLVKFNTKEVKNLKHTTEDIRNELDKIYSKYTDYYHFRSEPEYSDFFNNIEKEIIANIIC